ncbi:MAG: zinc metallopeptidase [Lachnospiraceae bacterium]|nr:zinc metallopeptidase [Lachnospiraceae bacterium]
MGYGYGYYYDWTYILVIIAAALSLIASQRVKSTFKKYSAIRSTAGMTGAEVAAKALHDNGVYDVRVMHVNGELTDHYDPRSKTVNLSDPVYNSSSVAAIGVAVHECGHAMQHNESYAPLAIRSAIVPVANFGSKAAIPIVIAGLILSFRPLLFAGILLFTACVAFQVVTLPVEFNASARALEYLKKSNILDSQELSGSEKVLKAAAMTYVAAAAGAVLNLLRLIILSRSRNGRRGD